MSSVRICIVPPPSCVWRSHSERPSRNELKPTERLSSAVGGSSMLKVCLIHAGTLRPLSRTTKETPADGAACAPPSIGTYIENLGSTKLSSKTWYAGVVRPPASALMVRSAATSLGGRSGTLSSPVGSFSCTTNDSPSKRRSANTTAALIRASLFERSTRYTQPSCWLGAYAIEMRVSGATRPAARSPDLFLRAVSPYWRSSNSSSCFRWLSSRSVSSSTAPSLSPPPWFASSSPAGRYARTSPSAEQTMSSVWPSER